ncbi:MAG: hypothetical protein V4543_07395 [Bacteroidota bacterium]
MDVQQEVQDLLGEDGMFWIGFGIVLYLFSLFSGLGRNKDIDSPKLIDGKVSDDSNRQPIEEAFPEYALTQYPRGEFNAPVPDDSSQRAEYTQLNDAREELNNESKKLNTEKLQLQTQIQEEKLRAANAKVNIQKTLSDFLKQRTE